MQWFQNQQVKVIHLRYLNLILNCDLVWKKKNSIFFFLFYFSNRNLVGTKFGLNFWKEMKEQRILDMIGKHKDNGVCEKKNKQE